ncbi:exosortase-dependent surface protein XDP1 [Alteromonas ponticola]|uniref:PEP-CTERM sorting domain-containing protein n=1 Tax=Alteromonas ponticola TaxID=2720613 RepID=A0ABX1QXC2_9ALTE|nr:exosortase-dependent surface protein XDP1 [Alteromonas ponticola]NMH58893.1 PEP-CTERM sorting domain-containing protein [Alteromonas ponticola]
MKLGKGFFAVITLCLGCAQNAFADDTTWNFRTSGQSYGSGNYHGNNISQTQGGLSVSVTAWADTGFNWGSYTFTDKVETATVASNSNGLLNYNRAYTYGHDGHAVDNETRTDMLLFSFSEAVSLTSLDLGWTRDGSSHDHADLSIAAFSELPTFSGNSWNDIVSDSLNVYSGSFGNVTKGGYSLTGIAAEAKYWLIGAYNSVFGLADGAGTSHIDQFKIAALTTHSREPDGDVPTPATGVLMALVLAAFAYRRRSA